MNDEIDIRPLSSADSAAFRAIRLRAIVDSPSAVWPTLAEEEGRTQEEVMARIAQTDAQVVFGAFDGPRLIGIAGLRREVLLQVAHKATLWGVFVDPAWRKAGIARRLFALARAHAQRSGVLQIQLCVNAANLPAQSLYRALGFVGYGLEPRAMRVGERFYDEQHMALRLGE
ncbi:GNAT family N-acetyltransferase [Rugamonas sp. DEMB1]|nr:GNAT family N-acetyltransferase [Rugamonas sp. DEMB1]WGG53526.1 GNAT family N-acetyltransferase [Rugamonas sp. DEMB1]